MITKKLLPTQAGTAKPLTVAVQKLATNQVITDLTSTNRGNVAITPLADGEVIGKISIPKKFRIKITNTNDTGELDIPFLNSDSYMPLPAGVTVTYSDGFTGKLLNRLMTYGGNGEGLLIYGFNVTGYDDQGVKSDSVLNGLEMELRYYIGKGQSWDPNPIDFSGAERNTQVQTGLLTVKIMALLNFLCQAKVHLAAGEAAEFVFSTEPLQD